MNYLAANYLAALPPLLMALFGCATLLLDVVSRRALLVWFNLAGQALVGYSLLRQWQLLRTASEPVVALNGSVTIDGLALFTNGIVWFSIVTLLFISYRYLEIVHENRGEYYALAIFAQCGMYFMAAAADLVVLFVGLELTAISFYILVGFTRADRKSNEASLKYLLLGAIATGFILYGFSLLYGISGSTSLNNASRVFEDTGAFGLLATVTVLSGLLLKVSAAPFHNWAPDAYDGAPTPITGYLSVASKVASFAVLIRLLSGPIQTEHSFAQHFVVVAAVLSLTVGSIAAITQARVKRLFGYSGVAHAGYLLLGLVGASRDGVFVYLLVYAVMNLGAFAVLTSLRRHGIAGEELSDLRGLSRTYPVHAALFAVLLLSLAGIPPTAGFIGKYYIFAALIKTGHVGLAVVASAYIVVSLYFYFRLVREMYLEPGGETQPIAASFGVRAALVAMSAATLLIGLFPEPVLRSAAVLSEFAR
jgi:NADH-quinone oxidoreductase subunit N